MRKFKKHIFLILLIIIGIFLCIYGFTAARYVTNSVRDYYLKSQGFYFTSDYLSPSTVKNVDNLWNGGSVYFSIKNSLNEAVITNYDIAYTTTCTIKSEASTYAECRINGTNSNTQDGILSTFQTCINNTGDEIDVSSFNKTDCELGGYDWVNEVAVKELYFDIVVIDTNYELKDVVANITVTSTSPYRKTLSGDFTLHKSNAEEEQLTINYKNYSGYDRLIISNSYPNTKCVKVTWDANKLVIDADRNEFSSYATNLNGYINEIKFNIAGKKSKSYTFYRNKFDIKYDVTEFSIMEDSGC
ncbi:MAG: hypothetical protein PHS45_01120 [Bacilli bacterium]|nr:hypothetical protein [Bacilli bacterium]